MPHADSPSILVRPEHASDHAAVGMVLERAFEQPDEARLVERLRADLGSYVSLVAEADGVVVGHAFFSPVRIEATAEEPATAALGPVAVEPDWQRRGAGTALIRDGLGRCADAGWPVIFVLGDPRYYGRFGFTLAAPLGLHYETHRFDPAFQVLELTPGALGERRGWVRYPEAFDGM